MSQTHPTAASSSNFQLLFNNALRTYEKHTKKNLLLHPLAAQLQACSSPSAILDVLHQQVQELNQSRNSHQRLTSWLDPTVNVLYAFSGTFGEGVSLVCFKTVIRLNVAFNYDLIGILTSESDLRWIRCPPFSAYSSWYLRANKIKLYNPQAVKDVRASQDTLIDIFERIENFFRRLENYAEVPPTPEMMNIIGRIMVEILCILAIATKEIKQGRTSELSMDKYVTTN